MEGLMMSPERTVGSSFRTSNQFRAPESPVTAELSSLPALVSRCSRESSILSNKSSIHSYRVSNKSITKSIASLSSEQRISVALAELDLRQAVRRERLHAEIQVQPLRDALERTRVTLGLSPESDDEFDGETELDDEEETEIDDQENVCINDQTANLRNSYAEHSETLPNDITKRTPTLNFYQNSPSWIDEHSSNEVRENSPKIENPLFIIPVVNPTVPEFTGDPQQWPEWMLMWRSRVDENVHLTDARRTDILGSSLSEEPRSKIFALLWDARNYNRALSELQRIYGNPALVIESYLNQIRSYPIIQSNSDIPGLCTKVTQLVQTFQTMDFKADLHSKCLLSELKGKLPEHMLESWGQFVMTRGNGNPTVILFHDWLVEREEALRLGGFTASRHDYQTSYYSQRLLTNNASRRNQLSGQATSDSKTKTCIYCTEQGHWIENCLKWKKISNLEKQTWFYEQNRCFTCSRRGHIAKGCTSKNTCRQCTKRHHTCVHDISGFNKSTPTVTKPSKVNISDSSSESDYEESPPVD